jgi:phytoene dehydrogenase-like protein
MLPNDTYDGIIIGAGHNGLILQAYLGKAGVKTLCIDRAATAGGGLATVEHPPQSSFRHNTHSFFHRAITRMPWYRDLELERLGASYLEPPLNVAMLLADGRSLEWWTDFERTVESFESFSSKDARALRRWRDEFVPIAEKILVPEAMSPPLPPERRRQLLERTPPGRRLLEVSRLSPLEFVLREFEHPAIQAGLLFFNGLREVDLRAPGFGHHIAFLLASPAKAQMCRNGSATLARALTDAVGQSGGTLLLQTGPKEIVVENGRAAGVALADGRFIRARQFVASSLNPQQTFLDLLDPGHVPGVWRERAANFKYNLLAPLFSLNLNLSEPPRYTAAEGKPHLHEAFMVILGLERLEQFHEIVACHERGTMPPTAMWGACPTVFDPSQAPPGRHTAFMWEKLPYRLNNDPASWDAAKQRHGEQMLAKWKQYSPNLQSSVLDWFTRSPLDTERSLPNMREGDLLVGAFTHGQVGYNRPFPGAGHFRTHLPGLYLCGSSSHPGGNVTGLPGYNAAQVLLADLGLKAPWAPPSIEDQLAALA